jgi:hypothetical protein
LKSDNDCIVWLFYCMRKESRLKSDELTESHPFIVTKDSAIDTSAPLPLIQRLVREWSTGPIDHGYRTKKLLPQGNWMTM